MASRDDLEAAFHRFEASMGLEESDPWSAATSAAGAPVPEPRASQLTDVERAVMRQQLQAEAARQRSIESPTVPPEYRGTTWSQATRDGVIQSPYPPIRPDGHEIGDDFLAFRSYVVETDRLRNPDYYCVRCRTWPVSRTGLVCGHCRVQEDRQIGLPSGYDESKAHKGRGKTASNPSGPGGRRQGPDGPPGSPGGPSTLALPFD